MKVLAQFKYKDTYKREDGTEVPYEKVLTIVKNGSRFPIMVSLPGDTPDLRGKEIEPTYSKYGYGESATYKISGYKIIGE